MCQVDLASMFLIAGSHVICNLSLKPPLHKSFTGGGMTGMKTTYQPVLINNGFYPLVGRAIPTRQQTNARRLALLGSERYPANENQEQDGTARRKPLLWPTSNGFQASWEYGWGRQGREPRDGKGMKWRSDQPRKANQGITNKHFLVLGYRRLVLVFYSLVSRLYQP